MSISRRKFLSWLGVAGAGTFLGRTAKAASNKEFGGHPGSHGVLFDNVLCIGCRNCEEGCNQVNELPSPDRPFDEKNLTRPGLKAAYHQLCLGCHEVMKIEKPSPTGCTDCHKEVGLPRL